jgi:hypothetical protein
MLIRRCDPNLYFVDRPTFCFTSHTKRYKTLTKGSNVRVQWLALLLRNWEASGSILEPEAAYTDSDFSRSPQCLQENAGKVQVYKIIFTTLLVNKTFMKRHRQTVCASSARETLKVSLSSR